MLLKKVLPGLLLMILGCVGRNTAYTGTYHGQSFKITGCERKGFSTNSVWYELKLGSLNRIAIYVPNIDIHGEPYSDAVFKSAPRIYIDTTMRYIDSTNYSDAINRTMLYFDPDKYSIKDFNIYADFFKHQWAQIEKEFNKNYTYLSDHIVGLVYGKKESFAQTFHGNEDGKDYFLQIGPDGYLWYDKGKGPKESLGFESIGLSEKVEMPGKIIRIHKGSPMTIEKLKNYKDEKGKSIGDYFTIIADGN